jgi:hypothetical protein
MKFQFTTHKGLFDDEQLEVIEEFIKFLHKRIPLTDVDLKFVREREGKMTTGVRLPDGEIKVLSGGRMLLDVLRTLAHEWIHEGQNQILGWELKHDEVGGPSENQANSVAGAYLKEFQMKHPEFIEILYK